VGSRQRQGNNKFLEVTTISPQKWHFGLHPYLCLLSAKLVNMDCTDFDWQSSAQFPAACQWNSDHCDESVALPHSPVASASVENPTDGKKVKNLLRGVSGLFAGINYLNETEPVEELVTEDDDDEVFRAPSSPTSEGLKKVNIHINSHILSLCKLLTRIVCGKAFSFRIQ
jgi:hypothetical protein